MARKGDPSWPKAFAEKQTEIGQNAATGIAPVIKSLKALGVLPIFPPYLAPRIIDNAGFISRWDRLAFRLAVAHLLSWESWCRRAAQEHISRRERVQTFRTQHGIDQIPAVALLRRYEIERKAELERVALSMGIGSSGSPDA